VQWKARHGLSDTAASTPEEQKLEAPPTGVRGETYAYWCLRRLGYIFVARNYMPEHGKGELDLIGFEGDTLAFVEVRTRLAVKGKFAIRELSSTPEKHETLIRTGHYFLRERPIKECPLRFDVVAIDNTPGQPPLFDCTSPLSVPLSTVTPIGSSSLVTFRGLAYTRRPREWSFSIKEFPLCECLLSVPRSCARSCS
jgi:putative endonuclease